MKRLQAELTGWAKAFAFGAVALILSAVAVDKCSGRAEAWPNGLSGGTDFWGLITQTVKINPAWQQSAWIIDPSNVSGCASDANTGQCAVCGCTGHPGNDGPLLTWHELNDHRWGCMGNPRGCPRLRQNTNVVFNSSHTDNTDPVYFFPTIENGSVVTISGNLNPGTTCSGTISAVTVKTNSPSQLWSATLPAGCGSAVAGAVIINSTHQSNAFLYQKVSGTTWTFTQPVAPALIPFAGSSPSSSVMPEVNTWANGDTILVENALTAVNIADVEPILTDYNVGLDANTQATNVLYLNFLQVFDPIAGFGDPFTTGNVAIVQSQVNRYLLNSASFVVSSTSPGSYNVYNSAGMSLNGGPNGITGGYWLLAGAAGATALTVDAGAPPFASGNDGAIFISGDFIDDTVTGMTFTGPVCLNSYYIEAAKTVTFAGATTAGTPNCAFGADTQPGTIWGPGTVSVSKAGQLTYGDAGALFATMHIGASGKACSMCNAGGATFGVFPFNCGINITAGSLAATCGDAGFGGQAIVPGSGTIANHQ